MGGRKSSYASFFLKRPTRLAIPNTTATNTPVVGSGMLLVRTLGLVKLLFCPGSRRVIETSSNSKPAGAATRFWVGAKGFGVES
jgi:hypothetical protein